MFKTESIAKETHSIAQPQPELDSSWLARLDDRIPNRSVHEPETLFLAQARATLVLRAIERGAMVREVTFGGPRKGARRLHTRMLALGGRLVFIDKMERSRRPPATGVRIYAFDGELVISDQHRAHLVGVAGPRLSMLARILRNAHKAEIEGVRFGMIARNEGGFHVRELPPLSGELERDNYSSAVLAGFDRAAARLNDSAEGGRLILLDGPPGTGKTHLVRGLAGTLEETTRIILVPADMVAQLAGPELISTLAEHSHFRVRKKLPKVVLVIEDADECLVPRQLDNVSAISALLNLGDGIIGAALNVRLIVTTNAEIKEIDAALKRPGRLAEHIHVCALDVEEAQRVAERLATGAGAGIAQPMTLAEVYARARALS